jgi:hypothetical protein
MSAATDLFGTALEQIKKKINLSPNHLVGGGWLPVGSARFGKELYPMLLPGFENQMVNPVP